MQVILRAPHTEAPFRTFFVDYDVQDLPKSRWRKAEASRFQSRSLSEACKEACVSIIDIGFSKSI